MANSGQRSLRRRVASRLTRRGLIALVVAVAAGVAGYAAGREEYLVLAGVALALPLIALAYVRLRRPLLEVNRMFHPPVVAAGAPAKVVLRVRNAGTSPTTPLAWNDVIPWRETIAPGELDPIAVGSSTQRIRSLEYEIHPERRGLYAIGPFVAEHEDPFGMAISTVAIGDADRLVVIPALVSLSEGGPSLVDGEGAAQLVQRKVAGNDDDLSTREYRPGDALRRVHWRASARHGELMVRQEEHRSHPDARILVDTRRRGYPDAASDSGYSWSAAWASDGFEWVMRMTASLGIHLEQSGFRVAIEESARPQIEPMGERWEGRRAEGFLTSLAAVELLDRRDDERPTAGAPDAAGPLFAVLGDPEDATIDWLISRRRGEAGFAFLVDARPTSHERLRDAGWCTVDVAVDDHPDDAWRAASLDAGFAYGAR